MAWQNSTFGYPDRARRGRYLIALARPGSPSDPSMREEWRRNPGGEMIDYAVDLNEWTPLQRMCSSAFILPLESAEADAVLRVLNER